MIWEGQGSLCLDIMLDGLFPRRAHGNHLANLGLLAESPSDDATFE
jgi:hypothetical protein